jgi:SAM-dependent methyltransferase
VSYRDYWTTTDVPAHTGAINANGVEDIQEVLAALHVDLTDLAVIDVGCGTGRLAALCGEYVGLDIAPSQVDYAKVQGLDAYLIDGPTSLDDYDAEANIVCCLSVFTHVDRDTRRKYLAQFTRLAQRTLVDILPGSSEAGGIPAWYTASSDFELDLLDAGYTNFDSYDRRSGDGYLHRYYLAW